MTDRKTLNQAREWADDRLAARDAGMSSLIPLTIAAAEVIQSLPDEIIDGATVRGIIQKMAESLATSSVDDFAEGYDQATYRWRSDLEALLPATRTLADMDDEEREKYQWAQARIPDIEDSETVIITNLRPRLLEERARILFQDGHSGLWPYERVIPLPNLPKLEWPGNEPENSEDTTDPEFDPDYLYRDKEDDVWECINGKWVTAGTPNERKDLWELGAGVDTPRPKYGPYTRTAKRN